MLMKIYVIGFVLLLTCLLLFALLKIADSMGRLTKIFLVISTVLFIVFYFYNIYLFKIEYSQDDFFEMVLAAGILAMTCIIIFGIILGIIYFINSEYLQILLQLIMLVPIVIGILPLMFYMVFIFGVFGYGKTIPIKDSENTYKEYSHSIEIVEMEEIPYANVSGSRWYIRTSPSIAYYYDVVTESGNYTTKTLDGYNYYIEKDEDNKYKDNPHIKVYSVTKNYINLYGDEKNDLVTYEYTICVPENSIYYAQ